MRRTKIGDVYYVKVPNGYKLFQFAYRIPKRGTFIRVFDGLHETIPDNIVNIVNSPHSFIIDAQINKLYRIGLIHFVGNFPVPSQYPYPNFRLRFWPDKYGNIHAVWITPSDRTAAGDMNTLRFAVSSMSELPSEYQNLNLLSEYVTPDWLLYLFDYNFNMSDLKRFWPTNVLGDKWKFKFEEYAKMIEDATMKSVQGAGPIGDSSSASSSNKPNPSED